MPGLTLPDSPTDSTDSTPSITLGKLGFLADLPRYKTEKPCLVVPPAKPATVAGVNPPNVKMDYRENVPVEDVRPWMKQLKLDEHGFQILRHKSEFGALDTKDVCDAYKKENQAALEKELGAEKVITWGLKQRMPHQRAAGEKWDYWNEVEIEKPAVLAHCDFTYERGRDMVERKLGVEETQKYLDNGYRIRVINTWRPLVPVIERQPLALCDPRSVKPANLIKCDRVLVDDIGEVTLLQHDEEQKWYYLKGQTTAEPYIFCTWDSEDVNIDDKEVVLHSPHVAFDSPLIRSDAPPRFSVESRSVVVTKK